MLPRREQAGRLACTGSGCGERRLHGRGVLEPPERVMQARRIERNAALLLPVDPVPDPVAERAPTTTGFSARHVTGRARFTVRSGSTVHTGSGSWVAGMSQGSTPGVAMRVENARTIAARVAPAPTRLLAVRWAALRRGCCIASHQTPEKGNETSGPRPMNASRNRRGDAMADPALEERRGRLDVALLP